MFDGRYPIPLKEAAAIQRRLCEARAWCLERVKEDDARCSLRSAQLEPSRHFIIERRRPDGGLEYDCLNTDQRIALIDELANRRSALLAGFGIFCPDWSVTGGGKLLAVEIDFSLWEALSELESDGFVDGYDIPPWDTWVHLQHIGQTDVLLCWVPDALIEHVNKAILVNCVNCLSWVDELVFPRPEWETRRWF